MVLDADFVMPGIAAEEPEIKLSAMSSCAG